MRSILTYIRKKCRKRYCYGISALGFIGAFIAMGLIGLFDSIFARKFIVIFALCYHITGILFFLAGLHDSSRDEDAAAKPLRFYTLNEDGKIVLKDVDTILAEPSIGYKETRRADGKVDVSMEIYNKEQAIEVLAALAVMYDKGDVSSADYHRNVQKIREHFNL